MQKVPHEKKLPHAVKNTFGQYPMGAYPRNECCAQRSLSGLA